MGISTEIEEKFWRTFNRVVVSNLETGDYQTSEVERWDSLKHVELVFELEEVFDIQIGPEDIVRLYTSTGEILRYLDESVDG